MFLPEFLESIFTSMSTEALWFVNYLFFPLSSPLPPLPHFLTLFLLFNSLFLLVMREEQPMMLSLGLTLRPPRPEMLDKLLSWITNVLIIWRRECLKLLGVELLILLTLKLIARMFFFFIPSFSSLLLSLFYFPPLLLFSLFFLFQL